MKRKLLIGICLVVTLMFIGLSTTEATELVINGNFSNGLNGWTNSGHSMTSWDVYSGIVSIVDDAPMTQVLHLNGINGANYYTSVNQTIVIDNSYNEYNISFDWKVTDKESTYGANYVQFAFLNSNDEKIGLVSFWDTARSSHTLSYIQGTLPDSQFYGERKFLELFDWEHVSLNTLSVLPSLNYSEVASIKIQNEIQTDINSGGVMLVDNISVVAIPEPFTISLLAIGSAVILRRRKK